MEQSKLAGLSKENINYTRANLLVSDLGREAVREVFDKIPIFEPKVLSKNLEMNRKSRKMKAVPPFLRKILFPSVDESRILNSIDFDLNMMAALMNSLYTPPPAEVLIWDATRDSIRVINENKSKLAHSKASISDQSFNEIWRDTSNAILSIVDTASSPKYRQKMINLLQMSIGDEVSETSGTEIPADIGPQIQDLLKENYRDEMAYINCNPLDPNETTPIDELFVKLTLVHEDVNYKPGQEKKTKPLQHYRHIFEDQSEREEKKEIRYILIQGESGMGKTTLSKRMAVDWAEGKEFSERFENVFVLTLRKVQPGQTLVDVIAEQLLPYKSPLVQYLETFIDQNQSKILFLFDGLDEMKQGTSKEIDEMIKRNYLKSACLVITSRPTEAQHLTKNSKVDQHATIEGFDEENVKSFIANFFGESVNEESAEYWWEGTNPDDNTSTALFKETKMKGLLDIAKIPLILNILCLLYNGDRSLPENKSKIYQKLQQLLNERKKGEESKNEAEIEDILQKSGRIAFEGLMKKNNQLFFKKEEILKEVGEDALKIGLICIEETKYREKPSQVYFLHKSFQEYTAACYLGKQTDINNNEPWEKLKNNMKTIKDIGEQDLLLQFCAGASQKLAEQILDFLDEYDPKLKVVLQSMEKLSQNKDLTKEELETVCDYNIGDNVKEVLELKTRCLSNVEKPTEMKTHVVNQVITGTELKNPRQRNFLKPNKCWVKVSNDEELEHLIESTTSVSWIKLEGEYVSHHDTTLYSLSERTVDLLRKMRDRNEHKVSVCIGKYCEADYATMSKVMELLKSNTKFKYKLLIFGAEYKHINKYSREEWEKVFEILSGIMYLIGLKVRGCDIPVTVLPTIGQIINENADTLLHLDLGYNRAISKHMHELNGTITKSLSLTVLKLRDCLDPSDTEAVRQLLRKCKEIQQLDITECECEIGEDILDLKNLKDINITATVNEDNGKGLHVGHVLSKLDKLEKLEVIKAWDCGIDDTQVQNIPLTEQTQLRNVDLDHNRIGPKGLKFLCQHHTMLEEIRLNSNRLGDEGGKVLVKHLKHFKQMRQVWVEDNGMSEEMKKQIEEKCKEFGIDCYV